MSVITYAGFVQYDIQFVIEVFASLAETNKQVRLLLIGPPIDDLLLTLPRHARERVLQTGILTGQDTLIHLAASDILLLPFLPKVANIGRWPNKIGEYMCLAKPIVTNPVGDVNEAIGAGAALGAPAEARAYAATIHDLLTDSERRFALGRQARLAAETVFDYANFIPRLEAAYSKAAGEA
jgi:glycosyltransferase involved in cell wall biosynthesis